MIIIKVLLVNCVSDFVMQKASIPLGLLSIATYLTNNGNSVQIYDRCVDRGDIKKYLNSFSPDIVGISALAFKSFPDAIKVSEIVKKKKIPVVWGGAIPSLVPELILKSEVVDYVVMGDGEITFLALIDAIILKTSLYKVDGLVFFDNGIIVTNKAREVADLAQLPIIDFSFVDPKKYFFKYQSCKKMLNIYASKGCYGQCTYCYSPTYSNGVWRARPSEYYISEIKYLVDTYNMDGVYFVDDILGTDVDYINSFCEKLVESGINVAWSCCMRADACTKEELQIMYNAGCRWIMFGIESGSEERQKKIKKRIDLNKAINTINYCSKLGIITTTSFIIGYPEETEEELKETVNYARNLNSDYKMASFYGPIPKSELYYDLVKNNKLTVPASYKEWVRLTWMDKLGNNFSHVSDKELKVISSYFFLSIFTKKTGRERKSRAWVSRLIRQTIDLFKHWNRKSFYFIFISAKQFLEIVYYAIMYPGIRKKYNLYKKTENQ